ncbi:hypothetical protein PMKS-003299 [Pichia membranifaciens]|uniref:Uncharacterized protein n=1 Tax=Pichia membranifaciens TaxID=4926 RepID=A0A1Q2YJU4_9ASCO|nr:hypothetical protein PMKS-003299 [Pichia membranifaciens]
MLFCQLIKASLLNKLAIYSEALIDLLLRYIGKDVDLWLDSALCFLIFEYSEIGFNASQIALLFKLCYEGGRYSKLFYSIFNQENTTINSLIFNSADHKLIFENISISKPNSSFVLSSWIKLDSSINSKTSGIHPGGFDFLTLGNSKGQNLIHYSIYDGRISLVTKTEKQLFVSFELEMNKLYNITFAHICEVKKKIRVDLYINGLLIESKVIDTIFGGSSDNSRLLFPHLKNDLASKSLNLLVSGPKENDGLILELSSVYIIETSNCLPWILFLHMLGAAYSGSFKDSCLLSLLPLSSQIELNISLNEKSNKIKNDFFSQVQLRREDIILSWNSIVNQLRKDEIEYYYRASQSLIGSITKSSHLQKKIGLASLDSFNSIGGFVNCLILVEKSNSSGALVDSLRFLFSILRQHRVIENSFVSNLGYEILASILKSKKDYISIEVLDCVLNVVGYNEFEPAESIIKNRLAYRSLILDFDLWQTSVLSQNKIVNKFLLFQFTVFLQDSRYHQFNLRQISDMKIIKRILLALKRDDFHEDILPAVNSVLLVMLKYSHSLETVRLLLLHVIFTISMMRNEKPNHHKQQLGGELVLDLLQNLVEDYPKLLNTFSFKLLFSIMKGSTKMRQITLGLLVKMLRYNPKVYGKFLSSGGFSVISNLLRSEWDNDSILAELFLAAFNLEIANTKNLTMNKLVCKTPENTLSDLQCPHFYGVLINLMKFAALDLQTDRRKEALLQLDNFIEMLTTLKRRSDFDKIYLKNEERVGNLIFLSLVIHQGKSNELFQKYTQFLTKILVDRFYVENKEENIAIVENIYGNYVLEFNSVVIPLLFEKLRSFQSLMAIAFDNKVKTITLCRVFICYFQSYFEDDIHNMSYLSNFEMTTLAIKKIFLVSKAHPKVLPFLKILVREFNEAFITACMYLIKNIPDFTKEEVKTNLTLCCKIFMSHPDIIARSLDDSAFVLLFAVFYKLLRTDKDLESLGSNCIRVLLLEKSNFEKVIENTRMSRDDRKIFVSVLKETLTLNDEQVLEAFTGNQKFSEFVDSYYDEHLKIYSNSPLFTSGSDTINNYIKHKFQLEKSKKILDNDINPFNEFVLSGEFKNLNCSLQDEIDDFNQFISLYKSLKANVPFPSQELHKILYSTEGKNRKRNKIIKILPDAQSQMLSKESVRKTSMEFGSSKISNSAAQNLQNEIFTTDMDESVYLMKVKADEDFDEDKNRRILRNLFVHDRIDEVYNITQIIGLETIEAILVLGGEHIYIVEGYFYSGNGEICCNYEAPEDQRDSVVKLLTDLSITNQKSAKGYKTLNFHKSKSWSITDLVSVSKRKFLLRDVGFELFFSNGSSVLLTCINSNKRNSIFNKITSYITSKLEDTNLDEALKLASRQKIKTVKSSNRGSSGTENNGFNIVESILSGSSDIASSDITAKWCNGELSNFQYLMLLNTIAGRTFNDMTQYPVFPFVLSDYASDNIDLDDPNVYRDLSKPMGAQSAVREQQFKERYDATKEMSADTPPFHYGTHYSSAMIVTSYLIRLRPFTESYLKLQGGKFDHPDRLFYSIPKLWNSASQDNTTDVRELIPEFYYLPEFLTNSNNFQFGMLQEGKTVNDVELPPWADGDPIKFVRIMRNALESDFVSEHLHEWIDLIFGYKQQGIEAVKATNVFHYLSYPGSIDIEKIHDSHERAVIVSIIHNFGQTPLQIFRRKHPIKNPECYVNVIDIKKEFILNFRNVREYDGGKKPHLQNSGKCVKQLVFNPRMNKWEGLTQDEYCYYENELSMRIKKVGHDGLLIDKVFCIEQFTNGGFISCIKLLSKDKFVVGFNTGNLSIYELSKDKYKYLTNAQRSMVKLDYGFSADTKKKPLFQGFQNKSNDGSYTLLEIGNLQCGHDERIIEVEYLRNDRILITLDSRRKWLSVWHEPNKSEMENGEILLMNRLCIDDANGVEIVDFKVCEDDSAIYCITSNDVLMVWRINGGVVFKGIIGLKDCKAIHLCENLTGKDFASGRLFGVGFIDERGISKLKVCYLSRKYESVEIVLELDTGDDYEIGDAVVIQNSKFGEFLVVLGTAEGIQLIR